MSGWLEWFEESIQCPYCGYEFIALFCEEGYLHRNPIVITDLVGSKVECPEYKKNIYYKDVLSE